MSDWEDAEVYECTALSTAAQFRSFYGLKSKHPPPVDYGILYKASAVGEVGYIEEPSAQGQRDAGQLLINLENTPLQIETAIRDVGLNADPITDHPDWSSAGVPNVKLQSGTFVWKGPTDPDTPVFYKSIDAADVDIRAECLFRTSGTAAASFIMAARIVDVENFIGVRFHRDVFLVYERSGGTWKILFEIPQPPGTDPYSIWLKVAGPTVTFSADGVTGSASTVHLSSGPVGLIARGWLVTETDVMRDWNVAA